MVDEARPPIRARLREKWPEILLEAGSVLFAVLLAFAVDEWRESRANAALAARARSSVLAEVRANANDVRESHKINEALLQRLPADIAKAESGNPGTIAINVHLSQLTTAAWQAAQGTQAIQFMDYDWVIRAAKVYELQRLYIVTQESIVPLVSDIGDPPGPGLRTVQARLTVLHTLGESLLAAYGELQAHSP